MEIAGQQIATREWWQTRHEAFGLYASPEVLDEAAQGDAEAARVRLEALATLPVLAVTDDVEELTRRILATGLISREPLQRALREQGISYVFLGTELGARRSEPECYVNGRADYALIAQTPAFCRGLDRIVQGAAKMRIAMMCAEKDPLDCHRCILVSPRLRERGLEVQHILSDGSLESQEEAERRLAQLFELPERELFRAPQEILAEAYRLQGERIAYQEDRLALQEEPPKYGD